MPHRTAFAGYIYIEGRLARRVVAACVGSALEPPQYKPRDVVGTTSPPATHHPRILYLLLKAYWSLSWLKPMRMHSRHDDGFFKISGGKIWHQVSKMDSSLTTVRQIIWSVTGANSLRRQLCDTQRVSRARECVICAERKVSNVHFALQTCKWRLQCPLMCRCILEGMTFQLYIIVFNRDGYTRCHEHS